MTVAEASDVVADAEAWSACESLCKDFLKAIGQQLQELELMLSCSEARRSRKH